MGTSEYDPGAADRPAWNAGRKVGAKRALKPKQIWGIRFFLDQHRRLRDRALFDIAIDSKLRGCDVVSLKIADLVSGGQIRTRATIVQRKTGRPVQFERSCLTPRPACWRGCNDVGARWEIMSSQAASIMPIISAPANMLGLSMNGLSASVSGARSTAPTPSGEQKRRSSTKPPVI